MAKTGKKSTPQPASKSAAKISPGADAAISPGGLALDFPLPPGGDTLSLDSLFGHLGCANGLFSKETFLSLYSCITRMIRDNHQQLSGFVITRTLGDPAFEAITQALEDLASIPLYRVESHHSSAIPEHNGFLMVLTNRLCAALYWSRETHDTFQMYEGGWTFHPNDSKTMTTHVVAHLADHPEAAALNRHLDETAIDRRYDEKLNLLVTALVHGLENRNRQLTVALNQVKHLNHRVVQSERLAAIGQLSSVIAHEIRNPLGLIDLYAKLVEAQLEKLALPDDEQSDKLRKNLSQIREATGSLETILSELTNYARPLTLAPQEINLVELVHTVCEFYEPSYTQKGLTLSYPDPADQPVYRMQLDRDRIKQALINLLKNALEASPEATEVIVSVINRRGDDEMIYVKVSDQGCGIKPESAKKLFTPYFSTKKAGTGLGLAHSRKILQAHGGDVELIASYPNKGSTFALILPRGGVNLSQAAANADAARGTSPAP